MGGVCDAGVVGVVQLVREGEVREVVVALGESTVVHRVRHDDLDLGGGAGVHGVLFSAVETNDSS